jgi:hypothetical protein
VSCNSKFGKIKKDRTSQDPNPKDSGLFLFILGIRTGQRDQGHDVGVAAFPCESVNFERSFDPHAGPACCWTCPCTARSWFGHQDARIMLACYAAVSPARSGDRPGSRIRSTRSFRVVIPSKVEKLDSGIHGGNHGFGFRLPGSASRRKPRRRGATAEPQPGPILTAMPLLC